MLKLLKTPESSFNLDSDDSFALKSAKPNILKKKVTDIINGLHEKQADHGHDDDENRLKITNDEHEEGSNNQLNESDHDRYEVSDDAHQNHYNDEHSSERSEEKHVDNTAITGCNTIDYERSVFLDKNDSTKSQLCRLTCIVKNETASFIKRHFVVLFVSVLTIFIVTYLNRAHNTTEEDYKKDIRLLRAQNKSLQDVVSKLSVQKPAKRVFNVGRVEEGTIIDIQNSAKPYYYGLIFQKSGRHINSVMSEGLELGNCFIMSGTEGHIIFKFARPFKIVRIGLFHPASKKNARAIKNIKIMGINGNKKENLGEYVYKGAGRYQEFELHNDTSFEALDFGILSNHGARDHTCVYRIYVFAEEDT